MFRPQAQAETHSRPGGAPRTSSPTQAETHSKAPGPLHTPSPKPVVCCNFATAYFFLFLNRLQAQAHSGPGSSPRASRTISKIFLFFISRLQAQARAVAQQQRTWISTRFFIDSP